MILTVLLTVSAPLAESLRDQWWDNYRVYRSAFQEKPPVGLPPPPMTPRLVVVMVRGLRLEASRRMPTLNWLRAQGADIILELTPPTYRAAAEMSWLSGALPDVHGITTNSTAAPLPDTLLNRLSDLDRESGLVADATLVDRFETLVRRVAVPDDPDPARRDSQAITFALEMLRDRAAPATFVLVELTLLEHVARRSPEEYTAAAAATDFRLRELADALDLSNTTLVVAGDRGLDAQGNDGGGEAAIARVPWVMAGLGVISQTQAIASAAQFAPTLAVLAGVSLPTQAQDIPLFDVLWANPPAMLASARQLTTFYEFWSEATALPRFASVLLREHEPDIAEGDRVVLNTWRARLTDAAQRLKSQRLTDERLVRLPLSVGIVLGLLIAVLVLISLQPARALLVIGAGALAAVVGFWTQYGGPPSLSLFRDAQPADFLARLEWQAVALLLLTGAAAALATRACEDVFEAVGQVMSGLGLIALAAAAVAVWFYWQWGDAWSWTLPDGSQLALAQVALTCLAAFSIPPFADLSLELPLSVVVILSTIPLHGIVRLRRRA